MFLHENAFILCVRQNFLLAVHPYLGVRSCNGDGYKFQRLDTSFSRIQLFSRPNPLRAGTIHCQQYRRTKQHKSRENYRVTDDPGVAALPRNVGIILWNRSEEVGANARMTENVRRTEHLGSRRSGGLPEQRKDQWVQPESQCQTGDARDDVESLRRCWFYVAARRVGRFSSGTNARPRIIETTSR